MVGSKNIKVELIKQYDVQTGTYHEERNIKVNMQSIQAGLIKTLGATPFAVLMAIVSFCDNEGEAFPSQRKLANITGLSLPTVHKAIKVLLETEIDGVPILSRELETLGSRTKFSVYTITPKKDASGKPKKKTSRDYVLKFKDLYEKTFGFNCVVNYGRDCSLVKNKLMANFTEEEVDMIIEKGVLEYKDRWANSNYPYPSLTMVCTWIADILIKEHKQAQENAEEQQRIMEEAHQLAEVDDDRINKFFDSI
ncbi:TPA: helix-turn-helix domain-containing protein [Clostridium perfringens]|nr:helix-turn-helix domain-containing protein [Clostridium perfringens]